jgi:hypothetical protein
MRSVKPRENLDISTSLGVAPRGEDVEPLSRIGARTEDERAEHFEFTGEDKKLLAEVLAQTNGQPS